MREAMVAFQKFTQEMVKLRPDLKGHASAALALAAAGTYKDDPEGARLLFDSGVSLLEEKTMPLISDFLAAVSAGVEHFKARQQAGAAAVKPGADADVAAIEGAVANINARATHNAPPTVARPATGWRPAPAAPVAVTAPAPVAVTAPAAPVAVTTPAAPVAVTAPAAPVAVTAPPAAPAAESPPAAPAAEPQ